MGVEWHAPYELLKPETRDMTRAINSLMEELEAMDWYNQRVDVTDDPSLRRIIAHNRDEEKEHAAMIVEWIRRHDPVWDRYLREFLFSSKEIVDPQELAKASGTETVVPNSVSSASVVAPAGPYSRPANSLTVGSLRGERSGRRP
jgi:ferritin-like protein